MFSQPLQVNAYVKLLNRANQLLPFEVSHLNHAFMLELSRFPFGMMQLLSLVTKFYYRLVPTYDLVNHLTPLGFKMVSLFLPLVLYKTFSLQFQPLCQSTQAHSLLILSQIIFSAPTIFISVAMFAFN